MPRPVSDPFDDRDTISAPVPMPGLAWLRDPVVAVRIHGTDREIELPRDKARISIGKSLRCDVIVDDPCVSRVHCWLERRDDRTLLLRDRRSKNGTFLNGNRVEAAEVRAGSLVDLGKTRLVLINRRNRGRLTAYEELRGHHPAFRDAVETAIKAASSNCSVLVVGETGTGKELVARAIHEASSRSARPFVALNCGAIPRELIGSELFGHERGAFTGATNARAGVFQQADRGTLFLDELGELPLMQQPHLLRVLETNTVRRVGGVEDLPIDVRLVAATNRLEDLGTERSELRLDLYHRLATVVVRLPPLRERDGDIPVLVRAFLRQLGAHGTHRVDRSTMRILERYEWPGNVRELLHAVKRAVTLCKGELTPEVLLPVDVNSIPEPRKARGAGAYSAREPRSRLRGDAPELSPVEAIIRDAMLDALEKHGSIRRAAEALGMAKSTFADRAQRLGILTNG
ncbi:MAG TPA: sigma 54-interacting transcriptional regulator [Kofleriaceae bacterium]|nr:sigma 54-interacting transcriptional regulator [Kofleriaceae bacterium]